MLDKKEIESIVAFMGSMSIYDIKATVSRITTNKQTIETKSAEIYQIYDKLRRELREKEENNY